MILWFCFLFSLFYNSYALTYEQCKDHVFNRTNIDLYADSNIYTGRYYDCVISCDQRLEYKFSCYTELGFNYDLWWGLLFSGSVFLLAYSINSLKYMIRAEPDFKPKFNPQFITICSNIIVSILKIIWMACIFNGRDNSSVYGGVYLDIVLIKLNQSIIFSEMFGLILIWRTIVVSTTNMKKIDKSANKTNYLYAIGFISIMMFLVFPLSILGKQIPFLNLFSNIVVVLFIFGLMVSSLIYSFKLTKILNNGIDDIKRKNAITNIKFVNISLCVSGIYGIILPLINTFRLFEHPIIKLWIWVFGVHSIEFYVLFMIAYSTSYKAKNNINSTSNNFSIFKYSKFIRKSMNTTIVSINNLNSVNSANSIRS